MPTVIQDDVELDVLFPHLLAEAVPPLAVRLVCDEDVDPGRVRKELLQHECFISMATSLHLHLQLHMMLLCDVVAVAVLTKIAVAEYYDTALGVYHGPRWFTSLSKGNLNSLPLCRY